MFNCVSPQRITNVYSLWLSLNLVPIATEILCVLPWILTQPRVISDLESVLAEETLDVWSSEQAWKAKRLPGEELCDPRLAGVAPGKNKHKEKVEEEDIGAGTYGNSV